MSIQEQLYVKMSDEYDNFIAELKTKPPDEIINCAYECTSKADIVLCFEQENLIDDKEAAALLKHKYPLDEFYCKWLDSDVSYMDELGYCIESAAKTLTEGDIIEPEKVADKAAKSVKKVSIEEKLRQNQKKVEEHKAQNPVSRTTKKKMEEL
ncbi:hypothetical protein FACS1894120_1190 [Clostridia bacterium]|nr:hypothetical protein FACS1894120_1190 [Clostridia bacterium]